MRQSLVTVQHRSLMVAARNILYILFILSPVPGAHAGDGGDRTLPNLMTKEVQGAIKKGLDALAKFQQADGRYIMQWEGGVYSATATAVAGMAFLAAGSTPMEGPYADNVRKAMLYLLALSESRADGLIAGGDEIRCTYGHGYAMTFLGLCYGMEPTLDYEPRLRKALQKAIDLVARGQSAQGGWLYHPAGGGDEGSTTACVLQGLRACRNAGLKVPKETIEKAVGYLRSTQNPDGGIAYSSAFRGASRPSISAAAIACFYSAGVYDRQTGGQGVEAEMVEKLVHYVKRATNASDEVWGHYFYHNFYMAQAMYQRGGPDWPKYYRKVSQTLLKTQAQDGSWIEQGVGPTFGTAMGTIVLNMPLGYLLISER